MSNTFKIIIYWIAIIFFGISFFGSMGASLLGAAWGDPLPLLICVILLALIIFLIIRVVKLMRHK
ncbi:MAG: hypothetical protein WC694_00615 [Candidatus Paceibacterota bacterium]|jgi:hypothetical protein